MMTKKSNNLEKTDQLISYHFPGLSGNLEWGWNALVPSFQQEEDKTAPHFGFGSSTASGET